MIILPENVYERESIELLTITVRKNSLVITENVFLTVLNSNTRPIETDWIPAIITEDNKCGILISNLVVGTYTVWVKIVQAPDVVVMRSGTVKIV